MVRNNPNGIPVQIRGGADAAQMQYWSEQDIFLDDDFLTNQRLLVAAYTNGKLVAVGQKNMQVAQSRAFAERPQAIFCFLLPIMLKLLVRLKRQKK